MTPTGVSNRGALREIAPSLWSTPLLNTFALAEALPIFGSVVCDVMEDAMFTMLFHFVASDFLTNKQF